MTDAWQADLETAVRVLAQLVRGEFPAGYALAEIAATWGEPLASNDVAALARVERELAERGAGFAH